MIVIKTTGGTEFRLLKTRIRERWYSDGYYATRLAVQEAFQGSDIVYGSGDSDVNEFRRKVRRSATSIRLGCKRFNGEDYKKLRRWALHREAAKK